MLWNKIYWYDIGAYFHHDTVLWLEINTESWNEHLLAADMTEHVVFLKRPAPMTLRRSQYPQQGFYIFHSYAKYTWRLATYPDPEDRPGYFGTPSLPAATHQY